MADGTVLHTAHWGADDPQATVIIVHGVSEHVGRWEHVAEFLVAQGYDVFSYDQRAHGRSGDGVLDIERFDLFIDDLAEMVAATHHDGRPLVIYGHSMGGLITTLYAESSNQQPDLYVLSAPALVANVPAPLRLAANVLGKYLPKIAITSPVEQAALSRDPDVGHAYVNDPLVFLKGTTRFGREMFAAMERAREHVAAIRVPTLVVHGADDELVPPRASAPLAAAAMVERRVFPGLRHEMHNEPESPEVLGFIAGWIAGKLA